MADEAYYNLQKELEAERQRVRQLEEERTKLCEKVGHLGNQLENYKPLAEAWLREHMPSKEECQTMFTEMLAHPEDLLDFNDVVRELLEEFENPKAGENAA